ncbi:DNA-processing protein DprA [Humidisolicoccus flavus]|uniref:DNA-processing protein DprA n=1 Tax=Humidisolicoccus flavus TaxID=3111414 RepID=UPI0032451784
MTALFSDQIMLERAAAVAPPSLRDSTASASYLELFASGAWSTVVEPGDSVGGLLRQVLGPKRAFDLLAMDTPRRVWLDELGEFAADVAPVLDAAIARWRPRVDQVRILRAFDQGVRWGQVLLDPAREEWPDRFHDLGAHAPAALWVRGDARKLGASVRSVAVVGARASTGYGEHVTIELVEGLGQRGFAIVSGAAYGIDGVAHRAALASDTTTVAVLAGGLDRFYPAGHEDLLRRIEHDGVIVSEVPCGQAPTRWRFLQRNRLIAALASVTVVVEAGARSGSINTAGHAAALGRPLGAVPGPISSAASAGCHRLIREYGAELVRSAGDVAAMIDGENLVQAPLALRSSEEIRLLDSMSARTARTLEELAVRSGISPKAVLGCLGLLELQGEVVERGSGWVRTTQGST